MNTFFAVINTVGILLLGAHGAKTRSILRKELRRLTQWTVSSHRSISSQLVKETGKTDV